MVINTQQDERAAVHCSTVRLEFACGTDFSRCHPARDIAHLLAGRDRPCVGVSSNGHPYRFTRAD